MNKPKNIFTDIPNDKIPEELFETLLEGSNYKLKRIVSTGHITPEDEWYDQSENEWVLLLKGKAEILFDNNETVTLTKGDYLFIPAHKRHRVCWTDPSEVCVWLTLYVQ